MGMGLDGRTDGMSEEWLVIKDTHARSFGDNGVLWMDVV
jgi:hypothetical protein